MLLGIGMLRHVQPAMSSKISFNRMFYVPNPASPGHGQMKAGVRLPSLTASARHPPQTSISRYTLSLFLLYP